MTNETPEEMTPEEMAKAEEGEIALEKKKEAIEAMNVDIKEAIAGLSKKHDMKLMVTGISNEYGTAGMWSCPNTEKWDEMAFARFIDKNI